MFAIDGAEAVSGYSAGALGVDEGATMRFEFGRYFGLQPMIASAAVRPYIFTAWGIGSRAMPTAVERGHIEATTLGGGITFEASALKPFGSVRIGIEYANTRSTQPGQIAAQRVSLLAAGRF